MTNHYAGRDQVISDYNVSRETLERLDVIADCLVEWSSRINLVGPKEIPRLWERHIADSLQLVGVCGRAKQIVDLGSGAGFPGLVLAAAVTGIECATLVESVGKKCAFLREAGRVAGLPVTVMNGRIENIDAFDVDFVTARALAPLPKLLELSYKWLEKGAVGVFPKGESLDDEVLAAAPDWVFRHEILPSRTSPSGRILIVSEVERRGR